VSDLDRQIDGLFAEIRAEHEAAIRASVEHEKTCARCQLASKAIRDLGRQQADRDNLMERTQETD
jgi:hypothetical protein